MQLTYMSEIHNIIIYACFVLHNFCEIQRVNLDGEIVQQQTAYNMEQLNTVVDCLYSCNAAEGAQVRNMTNMYREHIPY